MPWAASDFSEKNFFLKKIKIGVDVIGGGVYNYLHDL
jgi:hypothetical protein